MDGTILRETLQAILPAEVIEKAAEEHGVVERVRKREIIKLVYALVLSAGSDDSGVLADAYRRYKDESRHRVVRGAFYAWLDDEMAELMEFLVAKAIDYASTLPRHLPGLLGRDVDDWLIFDSETVTLRDSLADVYPGSGSPAAVKVHKEISVGSGCTTHCHFGPAREHDSPHLEIGERHRGKGLLFDLGYVSLKRLRDCDANDTKYVARLKENWKPKVEKIFRGDVQGEFFPGDDFDVLLADEVIKLDGRCVDVDVVLGKGKHTTRARLVMIPGPEDYLIYLTNLPRKYGPHQVGDIYRVRFEIEGDNKLDKSGAQLDQIRATTESSVRIQLSAKLLHSLIVDMLIHRDNIDRAEKGDTRRGPLHRLALAFSIRGRHALLLAALLASDTPLERWDHLAELIVDDGRDPNWRSRPSVLDRLFGLTAPRGRPRKKKLRDCLPSAAPYRRVTCQGAVS